VRIEILVLGLSCLLVLPGLADQDSKDTPDDKNVQKISLDNLYAPAPISEVPKVTEITSDAEVDMVFGQMAGRIKQKVDFSKQRLLYLAWTASSKDKLSYTVGNRSDGPIRFLLRRGMTLDLYPHHYLYAIPKEWHWEAFEP
jgi:hypothetical protein